MINYIFNSSDYLLNVLVDSALELPSPSPKWTWISGKQCPDKRMHCSPLPAVPFIISYMQLRQGKARDLFQCNSTSRGNSSESNAFICFCASCVYFTHTHSPSRKLHILTFVKVLNFTKPSLHQTVSKMIYNNNKYLISC